MNTPTLRDLIPFLPEEATEIIIKGRETKKLFFSMPKSWKPAEESKEVYRRAPNGPYYKQDMCRWEIVK